MPLAMCQLNCSVFIAAFIISTHFVNDGVYARRCYGAALSWHSAVYVVAPFVRPNCEGHDLLKTPENE